MTEQCHFFGRLIRADASPVLHGFPHITEVVIVLKIGVVYVALTKLDLLSYRGREAIVEDSCVEDADLACPWVQIKPKMSPLRLLNELEQDYLLVLRQTQRVLL